METLFLIMVGNCAITQRKAGILIPTCPPRDELLIKQGPAEYYLLAVASRENYKGTYDCLFTT